MSGSADENALVNALSELVSTGRALLDGAAGGSQQNIDSQKLHPMFGLMAAGANFLSSLSVTTNEKPKPCGSKTFRTQRSGTMLRTCCG
ncbi:hypothetical protein SRHO_G00074680 [Serrasalmus rhombeus]